MAGPRIVVNESAACGRPPMAVVVGCGSFVASGQYMPPMHRVVLVLSLESVARPRSALAQGTGGVDA